MEITARTICLWIIFSYGNILQSLNCKISWRNLDDNDHYKISWELNDSFKSSPFMGLSFGVIGGRIQLPE